MATKSATIVSESESDRAYQEYVDPQWVALFNLDEVQTGMYRTGTFLAAHQFDAQPDMVVLAKAPSGGLMPVGAVLMTDRIYRAVNI